MPLMVPNLDDRSFTDLVDEALSMLPQYAPKWTNYNPSDPGITLIELLAYLTEVMIYRLDRVTRQSKIKFLELLREVQPAEKKLLADPDTPLEAVDEALRQTVLELRQPQRAVTSEDFEALALNVTACSSPEASPAIRARCFARMNLEASDTESRMRDCPGHVSLVIVPGQKFEPHEFTSILEYIRDMLEPRRLLTTQLHVVKPCYLRVSLDARIRTHPGVIFGDVQTEAIKILRKYFDPRPGGGPGEEGWPFGRAVYISEVYALLEEVEGTDYVQAVRILQLTERGAAVREEQTALGIQIGVPTASEVGVSTRLGGEASTDTDRLIRDAGGRLIAVTLRPYELVRISVILLNQEGRMS